MKKLLLAFACCTAVTVPAFAADLAVESEYDWSGFYAGVNAGYGSANFETTDIDAEGDGPWNTVGDNWDFNSDGFVGGIQAGFNHQVNSIVYGIEADIGLMDAHGSEATTASTDTIAEFDANWYSTVRGRIGFAADRVLIYGTGGLAILGADFGVSDFVGNSLDTRDDDVIFGWTAGGGVEWALTDSISVKAEYLYMDFGSEVHSAPRLVPATNEYGFEHDVIVQTATIGINFHF